MKKSSFFIFLILLLISALILLVCNSGDKSTNKTSISLNGFNEKMFMERMIEPINNYYIDYYRNIAIRDIENSFYVGNKLSYEVYYAGENYLLLKFDNCSDEDLYYNSTFYINNDFTLVNKRILDYDKLSKLYSKELPLIYTGSFYVPKLSEIEFNNFSEKSNVLNELEKAIKYRYFNYSENKPDYDYPIFYETTKALKVEILDFDNITTLYRILVYTQDSYIYEVNVERKSDGTFVFNEIPEASFLERDVVNFNKNSNKEEVLSSFVRYYQFFSNHVISCVKDNK